MNHYRSLDSGLSSPDDFESDLNDTNLASDQVLNSTALSNNSNNSDTCQSRFVLITCLINFLLLTSLAFLYLEVIQ